MDIVADKKDFIKGFGFALLATILWSGNFIVARALHQRISPVSLAFFRWSVATIFLFPIALKSFVRDWKEIKKHLLHFSLAAVTGVTLFNTFIYIAGKYSSATNLALIGTTAAPVFVLIISGLFLKQRIFANQILGALLCITGILLLLTKGNLKALQHFRFSSGDIWIFSAALAFAIYTVLVRKKPKEISSMSFLFTVFLIGTLFLLPIFLLNTGAKSFQWDGSIILTFLYLGLGASVAAFLLWNGSIKKIGPARTALFGNLIPVFSTIEASILLNEKFNSVTLISLVVIIAGLIVANLNMFFKR